jgi:hypothetical protein
MSLNLTHPTCQTATPQAAYRLCQLWLGLSDDAAVNSRVKGVVESVPSAKFVPLVYQVRVFTRILIRSLISSKPSPINPTHPPLPPTHPTNRSPAA